LADGYRGLRLALSSKHTFQNDPDFPSIGRCIYCGATEGLSDEHIIPFSLAGNFIFRDASCRRCAAITSRDELLCARGIFGRLRIAHEFPTRRKNERPTHVTVELVSADGSEQVEVPVGSEPTAPLFAPLFPIAGILVGREPSIEIPGIQYQVILPFPPDHDARLQGLKREGATQVRVTGNWGLNPFMCLLAKIGHGFAVAGYGADSFTPILPGYVLDKDRRLSHVIGGTTDKIQLPEGANPIHAWQLGIRSINQKHYVAVHLHLFRYLGYPVYEVIAGEAHEELVHRVL
jgi:hypothetical protein